MWDDFQATDLTAEVTQLDLPVYFCHGRHDYTCSYDLAREYLGTLRAPVKGFYTFDRSAHSPAFEEPGRFRRILREDVLAGETRLADRRELTVYPRCPVPAPLGAGPAGAEASAC